MFTSRKKPWIKAQNLWLIKNPSPLAKMKDILKNTISLDRKATSIQILIWKKKGKERFPLPEIRYYFKNWPLSNCKNGFQNSMNERISLSLNRKYVATGCNNGLAENNLSKFPSDGKATSNITNIWDIGTKRFQLARKSVSTSQNERFVEKKVYSRRKKL